MSPIRIARALRILCPAAGLLACNSCLAAAQENLNLLFSPSALANALVLPYSAVWPLFEFLMKLPGLH